MSGMDESECMESKSTTAPPATGNDNPVVQNCADLCSSQNRSPAPPPPTRHDRTLTLHQTKALSLLAAGHSDSAVARKLGIHRNTVANWRLFDPLFASRLNRLRKALWANTLDRLRHLLPKSLSILAKCLHSDNPSTQLRAAIQLLKIAGTSRLATRIGPDNLNDVLMERAQAHRAREYSPFTLRTMPPPYEDDLEQLHQFLLRHIQEEEAAETETVANPPPHPNTRPPFADAGQRPLSEPGPDPSQPYACIENGHSENVSP